MKRIVLTATFVVLSACTSNDDTQTAQEPVVPAADAAPADGALTVEKSVSPGADVSEPAPAEAAPAAETAPQPEAAAQPAPAAASGDLYVAVSHLNVRSGPGMANSVVNVLPFNTPVPNLGVENKIWVKIADGQYISRKYLSEDKNAQPIQASPSPQPATSEAPAETAPESTPPAAADSPEQPAAAAGDAADAAPEAPEAEAPADSSN